MNKRLPGWQDPPTREAIQAAIKSYDKDGNMKLDREEFKEVRGCQRVCVRSESCKCDCVPHTLVGMGVKKDKLDSEEFKAVRGC